MNVTPGIRGFTRTTHRRTLGAIVAAFVLIALVCLPPGGRAGPANIDLCVVCGQNGAASALLNIVLFVPLGVALWWRFRILWRVVAIGAVVSLGIEALQLLIPGRHTALSDLLANTLGAALGGLLAVRPRAWLMPLGRSERIAVTATALATCTILILAGVLFRPAAPCGDYYGQWTPSGPYTAGYDGELLNARVANVALPSRRLEDSERIRGLIASKSPFDVVFVIGSTTTNLTPVFRLVAGPYGSGVEVLQVGVDGASLVLTPRFIADDIRLARPEVQVENALAGFARGDTVAVAFQARPDHGYQIRISDGPSVLVGFTVGRSWSLMYATFLRSELALRAIDNAWLLTLAACVGWFALSRRRGAVALLACLIVAGTTPAWSYLLPTPPLQYASILAGFGVGMLLRRFFSAVMFSDAREPRAPAGVRAGTGPMRPRSLRSR